MANRSMQQKILKKKRRGRFARFSGGTTRFAVRIETAIIDKSGKHLEIPVGPISLSNQVPKRSGPNVERMATYYDRLRTFAEKIPPTKNRMMSEPFKEMFSRYKEILDDSKGMRIALLPESDLGRTDLFFKSNGNEFVIVDCDYRKRIFRRSRIYGRKEVAIDRWKNDRVTWVEIISPK